MARPIKPAAGRDHLPPDRLTARVLTACDAVGDFIESWGFRSIHGRVWTLMALRNAPMSQSEMAEVLGVSRSLVHLAVNELSHYGLVRPTGEHRNAPWEASLDVWPTITDVIRSREWMLIERARVALESALEEAERAADDGLPVGYDVDRLRLILRMTEFAQVVLRAVISVRMPASSEAFGRWIGGASRVLQQVQARLPGG